MPLPLFFQYDTDFQPQPVALENLFAGTAGSACWLLGGGPSLASIPREVFDQTPLPRMAINLAGTRVVRPTFWTSYDPTCRFLKSIYLDPGIIKFVHRRRMTDLVPGTTWKVADCPALFGFERDRERSYSDWLGMGRPGITDWNDSFIQAIDILYRLGFRTLYFAGCDMQIRPAAAFLKEAESHGVDYQPGELLRRYFDRCRAHGIEVLSSALGPQYHFDETKSLIAALQTDEHYYRIAQALRLSRRTLATAGLNLVSVTPDSRLNAFLPYQPIETVAHALQSTLGNPTTDTTRGRYTGHTETTPCPPGLMQDIPAPPLKPPLPPAPKQPVPPSTPTTPGTDDYLILHEGPSLSPGNLSSQGPQQR